jgi:hypothetical protein
VSRGMRPKSEAGCDTSKISSAFCAPIAGYLRSAVGTKREKLEGRTAETRWRSQHSFGAEDSVTEGGGVRLSARVQQSALGRDRDPQAARPRASRNAWWTIEHRLGDRDREVRERRDG